LVKGEIMSKIGKRSIIIPEGVTVDIHGQKIEAKGPKGQTGLRFPSEIILTKTENEIIVKRISNSKSSKALQGLYRNLINNIVIGVSQGFKKQLAISGLGFRAALSQGEGGKQKLVLSVGFSHPVEVEAPEGIGFSVAKNIITIEGIDKQLVGEVAAKIRSLKKPEPYKGKGIKYVDETIRRKPGKAVVKSSGAA